MWRFIPAFFILLCLAVGVSAQSNRPAPGPSKIGQPPQAVTQPSQQQPTPDLRGSESAPVVVKVLPAPKSKEEAAQEEADRQDISAANWWMVRLTGAIGFIGFVQLIVFGIQARRLRQTIHKMDEIATGQTADMKLMIGENARLAAAMETVAEGIAQQVANSAILMQNQREFWSRQMRAYVFLDSGSIINVADPPEPVPEGKPLPDGAIRWPKLGPIAPLKIRNSGHTPARDVVHWGQIQFREYPLASPLDNAPTIDRNTTRFSIAPGGISTKNLVMPNPLSKQQIQALRDGTGAIFVYGGITYTDAFGERRHSNYRMRHNSLSGNIGVSTELTGADEGNDDT